MPAAAGARLKASQAMFDSFAIGLAGLVCLLVLIAVAIFMFLPYCQMSGANVTVDVFTARMGERAKAVMALVSSLIAGGFAVLLLVQMSDGFQSYLQYPEVTPVLRLPLWTAFPPILLSLFLLLLAALLTMKDAWGALRAEA